MRGVTFRGGGRGVSGFRGEEGRGRKKNAFLTGKINKII